MQVIKKRMISWSCLLVIILYSGYFTPVLAIQTTATSQLFALQADNENTDSSTSETIDSDDESSETLEDPIVPTKIQWIILSGIALFVGLVSYLFKAHQLTTEGELNVYPITKTFSIPLHKPIYKFMLFLTASMALIGFAICLSIYNSVFMPDIVGVSIAGPIFAYLIHLLYLMEKGRKGDD